MVGINTLFTILCVALLVGLKILHKECISKENTITKVIFYVLTIPYVGYIIYLVVENWFIIYKILH